MLTRIVMLASSFVGLSLAYGQTTTGGLQFDGFEVTGSLWGIANPISSISGIPKNFRLMPTNPDDVKMGWGDAVYTITPDTVHPRTTAAFSVSFTPQFRMGENWKLRIGVNFTMAGLVPHPAPAFDLNNNLIKDSATNEVNVGSGLPLGRGVGTSLVYYTAVTGASWIPGTSLELERRMSEHTSLVFGIGMRIYRNNIQEGWDRYDTFTGYETHNLATTYTFSPSLGIKLGNIYGMLLSVGPALSLANMAPGAGSARINFNRVGLIFNTAFFANKHGRD